MESKFKVDVIQSAIKYAEPLTKDWFNKQFDGKTPIEYMDGIDCFIAFVDEYVNKLKKGEI